VISSAKMPPFTDFISGEPCMDQTHYSQHFHVPLGNPALRIFFRREPRIFPPELSRTKTLHSPIIKNPNPSHHPHPHHPPPQSHPPYHPRPHYQPATESRGSDPVPRPHQKHSLSESTQEFSAHLGCPRRSRRSLWGRLRWRCVGARCPSRWL
jgi:hypothetical protein